MDIQQLINNPDYIAYMERVRKLIDKLPSKDQQEIQREISSHIYESVIKYPLMPVSEALQNLGEPHTYLPEWIVTQSIETASNTFDPIRIIKQLLLGITRHSAHGFKYVLFTILYLLTFAFGSLCILKVISPSHTGLLIYPQGFTFGYNSDIFNAHEVLGFWFIPICVFITVLFYMVITLLLKASVRQRRKRYLLY